MTTRGSIFTRRQGVSFRSPLTTRDEQPTASWKRGIRGTSGPGTCDAVRMPGHGGQQRPSPSAMVLAAAALVGFVASLWTNIAASTVSPTWIADHKSLIWVLTGVFAGLAVWQVLRDRASGGAEGGTSADIQLVWSLAGAVETERQDFLDQALGARYRTSAAAVTFANPGPGDLPPGAEGLLVHWQAVDGQQEGDIETIAGFYQGLDQRRLAVLGRPG